MNCFELFLAAGARHRSRSCRRWRITFLAIYCCRKMHPFVNERRVVGTAFIPQGSQSYTALDILSDVEDSRDNSNLSSFTCLNKELLASLVKERSLEELHLLGGVLRVSCLLASSAEKGIKGDENDLCLRREIYGSNNYAKSTPKSLLFFVFEATKDTFLMILLGCAVVSLVFGIKIHGIKDGWYDGASIFFAVFLVVVVTAISNFKQSRNFSKLANENYIIEAEVIRDGRHFILPTSDIVVGDVVCLKIGDLVPADGVLLDGHSLQVDESSLTGESDHVEVNARTSPFITAGATVVDGQARMLVTSVGSSTTWGAMMASVVSRDATSESTPLQERLQKLTSSIGNIGIVVATVVLIVLAVRYFTGSTKDDNGHPEFDKRAATFSNVTNSLVQIVSDAITIIVVAVPEGLPLAVTLTLAYSMKRMVKDQAMVRKLSACETMGSTTTICTDKTGTLTMNKMQVTEFWIGEEFFDSCQCINPDILELLRESVALNTAASVYYSSETTPVFFGTATEKAILSWGVIELGLDMEEFKRNYSVIFVDSFSSEKKCSGVLIQKHENENYVSIHWKGAAEMILDKCSMYFQADGSTKEMNDLNRLKLEEIIKGMSVSSLRCIAFATKQVRLDEIAANSEGKIQRLDMDGLTLLGLVGLKDPCRPEVKESIRVCRSAGVSIKMITGDSLITAKAIALECGILSSSDSSFEGAIIEGKEFRSYSMEERLRAADGILVMARSSPLDKLLMVQCLKQRGHVVAVTGDGTNDAPALKEADVGLSMGIQGTTVAKESSDIVILDDNFRTIVTVLTWGRCVYNNIQKFIQFQLTVNIAALVINFVSSIASGKVPLTTVQMLWVNLIMDTMGALALATERPTDQLLNKSPVGRKGPLITDFMWRNISAQALFQVIVLLVIQFKGRNIFAVNEKVKNTLIFNTFVLLQVFNEFNSRKIEEKNVFKGITGNRLFFSIVAFTLILQFVMVEFLRKFASTERLSWKQWGFCAGISIFSWPIAWLVKCVPIPKKFLSRTFH